MLWYLFDLQVRLSLCLLKPDMWNGLALVLHVHFSTPGAFHLSIQKNPHNFNAIVKRKSIQLTFFHPIIIISLYLFNITEQCNSLLEKIKLVYRLSQLKLIFGEKK